MTAQCCMRSCSISGGVRNTHMITSTDFILPLGGVGVFSVGLGVSPVVVFSCYWSRWISRRCGLPLVLLQNGVERGVRV